MAVRQRKTGMPSGRAGAIAGSWLLVSLAVDGIASPASAQRIENGVAIFAALDKVTARISKLEIKLGETVKFGALKITPRACYARPPTEPPKTSSFVEVQEILLDGKEQRIFGGWMFAESPGLNAVEHPVFDLWLTECSTPVRPVAQKSAPGPAGTAPPGKGSKQQPSAGAAAGVPSAQQPWTTTTPAVNGEGVAPRRRPPR